MEVQKQTISKNIMVIADGIRECLEQSDLECYLEGVRLDLPAILSKLTNKYLSFYDDEIKFDLLMEMFLNVYKIRLEWIIANYDDNYSLYTYLYTIMKNEIIELSKKTLNKFKKQVDLKPTMDSDNDMSPEEAMSRAVFQFQRSKGVPRSASQDELDELNSLISDYEQLKQRILYEELVVDDMQKSLDKIDKKIEKFKTDKLKLDGFFREKYVDVSELSQDVDDKAEPIEDDFIIERLKAKLIAKTTMYHNKPHHPWDSDRIKIVDLLLNSFNLTECAIFFEVSPVSTNKWVKQIKEALFELADEMEFEEDDNSLVELLNQWLDDLEAEDRINKGQPDGCPTVKDKVELYRQIVKLFGADFMQFEK